MSAAIMISVREFERKVRELEEISITVRAPSAQMVPDYGFEKKAAGTASVTEWLDNRIKPRLSSIEFAIINSEYVPDTPNGRTKLSTLRSSYER